MTDPRWRRVEAALDEALTRPPEQWGEVLDRHCGTDPELRAEIEALLARLHTARGFLESPPPNLAAAVLAEAAAEGAGATLAGRRVGAWRTGEEIGRGGMSRVHLAERADGQYEQRVALKLLRPGLDSDLDLERFRAERQILATLNHPGIARLLDGGVTPDGVPWVALELVEGVPIDRHCRENGLPVRARLELFRRVLDAVQHAHQNLVVHRDLKPSNILVTHDGAVKLLDFGIAKLLDPGSRAALATGTGHRWMTPEYAAPEQVRGSAISTLTDVWQLGVVLFELLTGCLPFGERGAAVFALEEAILRAEPPSPSSLVPLPRTIARDLDAIVLQALRKEPERRYPSAAALSDDIGRLLDGRPVRARPDSAGYRLGKFLRRNRVAVAATVLVAGVLVGATAYSSAQRRLAERQRDLAVREARRSQALTDVQEVMLALRSGPGGQRMGTDRQLAIVERVLLSRYGDDPGLVVRSLGLLTTYLQGSVSRRDLMPILARIRDYAVRHGVSSELPLLDCLGAYAYAAARLDDSLALALATAGEAAATEPVCTLARALRSLRMQEPDSAVLLLLPILEQGSAQDRHVREQAMIDLLTALETAGRYREQATWARRALAELEAAGHVGAIGFTDAASDGWSALLNLGEFRAADSLIAAVVQAVADAFGEAWVGPVLSSYRSATAHRLDDTATAARWLDVARADTTPGAAEFRAVFHPAALARLALARNDLPAARAAAAEIRPLGNQILPGDAITMARVSRALGDRAMARWYLDSALASQIRTPRARVPALLLHAEWRLADGDRPGADSVAALAVAAAAVDSLALTRSAWVGMAEAFRARVALVRGDTAAALAALDRALPPLAHGYGPDHARTLAARALRDSLAR